MTILEQLAQSAARVQVTSPYMMYAYVCLAMWNSLWDAIEHSTDTKLRIRLLPAA
jgi:hypothetical protein